MLRRVSLSRFSNSCARGGHLISSACSFTSRSVHTVPKLPFDGAVGIPGLYSPEGFNTAWTEYQSLLVENLSRATVETSNETRFPFHILLDSAHVPNKAHIFNYASQAHNNHLFFLQLREAGTPPNEPSSQLNTRISQVFGDLAGLKAEIIKAADSLLDQGYVFLVEKSDKTLAVMAVNGAGSPYAFGRAQNVDLNAIPNEDEVSELKNVRQMVETKKKNYNVALLCLNLWNQAYLKDFGIDGRQKYIEAWWDSIDWKKVSSRLYEQ